MFELIWLSVELHAKQAAAIESMDKESSARSKAPGSKTTSRDGDDNDDEQEMNSPARGSRSKDQLVEEQVDGRKEPDDKGKEEEEEEEEEETSNDSDDEDWDPTKKVTSDDDSEETEMAPAPPGYNNRRSDTSFVGSDSESSRYAKKKRPSTIFKHPQRIARQEETSQNPNRSFGPTTRQVMTTTMTAFIVVTQCHPSAITPKSIIRIALKQ